MSFRIDGQSTLEFEYSQLLGRGRMSEIHIAECVESPDMKVAIKRHRSDNQNVDEWMAQVEKEISVLHHLNTAESPDWSFDMSLRNRITYADSTRDERSVIQLLSVFDIDGLTSIAIEIAPPSITSQTLDKYTLVKAMHQIASTTHMLHEGGLALTDIDPLVKIPRIRWDKEVERIKIIDWNITRETEDYRRRDLIYLGRIFFQLLTGYPAWAKGEPPVDYLPDRYNEYALDVTGASVEEWIHVETALRDMIERLMIQDSNDAINTSDGLMIAMDELKQLSDLAQRIENGSSPATNEMENLLQEASNARPPQLRRIANIGGYFLSVAPESRSQSYINQVESAENLLKTAYLDRIGQAIEYFNEQRYGDAVAELENARSRFTSNHLLTNAANYRYAVAHIGEDLQNNGKLDATQLQDLMDKLIDMISDLESRLWDVEEAEKIRDDIRNTFSADIVNMRDMQALFADIEASKLYSEQIKLVNNTPRKPHIEQGWEIEEARRLDKYNEEIIPNLQKVIELSFIEDRIRTRLEQLQKTVLADQRDLNMVQRFLNELREGATSIDIEGYLEKTTLERPYAPLTISKSLLPRDQSDLSSDEVAGFAIERYQQFRSDWDDIMQSHMGVEEKLNNLSNLVAENEDMITIFREKLPTVTVPGSTNERKTVYRDLEDLTQFVNSVDFVYDELGSIGMNRIPNISKIQKRWVYVTNVQDPELKRFVSSIQANLASHTNDKVQDKSLPPELSMLVYEMLDVPVPTSVMQIGQEIQLHKYIRSTLRKAESLLKEPESIDSVIGEFNRLTVRANELDNAIEQVVNKLEQLRDALQSRTIVRQIRTLYRVIKRPVESDNESMVEFGKKIDEVVDELIDAKVKEIEKALDKAKTNKPMDREEEILVHDTQRIIDTLRHNNRLQERRWHHVQNSQAYLLREYTRTLEQATTAFNDYQYGESREHIERAFYLAQLFDKPSDKRLPEELRTAEEMVMQLSEHFTMTRSVETVKIDDIQTLLADEIEFWEKLHEIVKDLGNQPDEGQEDTELELSFEPESVQRVIDGLEKAVAVTKAMSRIQKAVDRLREMEQTIDIYGLDLLKPLAQRLEDVLLHRYTEALSSQIRELQEIATRERIISNESVIKRVRDGYELIEMNKTLQILNDAESSRRRRELQTNSYTALRNMTLKNQDERQALADFIELMPNQEVQSRDFQGVLTRLAEDPNSYAYIIEQVHNKQLPNIGSGNSRQVRRLLGVVILVAIVAVVAGLILSGTIPLEGFTLGS